LLLVNDLELSDSFYVSPSLPLLYDLSHLFSHDRVGHAPFLGLDLAQFLQSTHHFTVLAITLLLLPLIDLLYTPIMQVLSIVLLELIRGFLVGKDMRFAHTLTVLPPIKNFASLG